MGAIGGIAGGLMGGGGMSGITDMVGKVLEKVKGGGGGGGSSSGMLSGLTNMLKG